MRPVPDILARNQLGSGLSVQIQEIEDIKNNVSLRTLDRNPPILEILCRRRLIQYFSGLPHEPKTQET